jgi:hypothetical protein
MKSDLYTWVLSFLRMDLKMDPEKIEAIVNWPSPKKYF